MARERTCTGPDGAKADLSNLPRPLRPFRRPWRPFRPAASRARPWFRPGCCTPPPAVPSVRWLRWAWPPGPRVSPIRSDPERESARRKKAKKRKQKTRSRLIANQSCVAVVLDWKTKLTWGEPKPSASNYARAQYAYWKRKLTNRNAAIITDNYVTTKTRTTVVANHALSNRNRQLACLKQWSFLRHKASGIETCDVIFAMPQPPLLRLSELKSAIVNQHFVSCEMLSASILLLGCFKAT